MKTICIDTNHINENNTLFVHELIVRNMGLKAGETVMAYQDEDLWEAEIVYSDGTWGAVLTSDAKRISLERRKGHEEGLWEGFYVQAVNILNVLKELNYDSRDIEEIMKNMGIK